MTYESWYTKFLTLYRDEIAEKTRESYERCYTAYIAPTLAAVELEDITPDMQHVVQDTTVNNLPVESDTTAQTGQAAGDAAQGQTTD